MEIIHKDNGKEGSFVALQNEEEIGEMTYFRSDDNTIAVNHTRVSSWYEGKGIGKQLMEKCVEFARENGLKIIPVCSFAKAMFERYPNFSDTKA